MAAIRNRLVKRRLIYTRQETIPALVATDLSARGIDVKNITLLINYDLIMEPNAYAYRIGCTARAGNTG